MNFNDYNGFVKIFRKFSIDFPKVENDKAFNRSPKDFERVWQGILMVCN